MLHPRFLTPYFALILTLVVCAIWALSYIRRHYCTPNAGKLPFRRPGAHGTHQSTWRDVQVLIKFTFTTLRPVLVWPFKSCLHFVAAFAILLTLIATLPLVHFPTDCDPGGYGRNSFGAYVGSSVTSLSSNDMIPLLSFRDVKDRMASTISDPHVVVDPKDSERLYLFFAVTSLNSKSEIAVAISADGGQSFEYQRVVLPRRSDAFAMSHPYVFWYDGHWYMMPIHDLTRGLPIYKAGPRFPYEWSHHTTLLTDVEGRVRTHFMYAHATIIKHNSLWWLFAYDDTHSLYAFSSTTPLVDASWIPHTKNPVQSHALPPAGPMISAPSSPPPRSKLATKVPPTTPSAGATNNVYRFVHDDSSRTVRTVQVTLLTPDEYSEEIIDAGIVGPATAGWNSKAVSHVSPWVIPGIKPSDPPTWMAIATGRGPCVYSYCGPPPPPLKPRVMAAIIADDEAHNSNHDIRVRATTTKHSHENDDDTPDAFDNESDITDDDFITRSNDPSTDDDTPRAPIWPDNTLVATACNSNHLLSTQYTLRSLETLGARTIFYDLGLTEEERESLPLWPGFEFRIFPFDKYPAHFDMRFEAGQYAWKPVMIGEMADEILGLDPDPITAVYPFEADFQPWSHPADLPEHDKTAITYEQLCRTSVGEAQRYARGPLGNTVVSSARGGGLAARRRQSMKGMILLWVDGASVIHTLKTISREIREIPGGFWCRTSADSMARWTHPDTFKWFRDHGWNFTDQAMGPRQPAEAGFMAFNLELKSENRDRLWCQLVEPWRRCSLYGQCIGPIGSNGKNHRQDQSIISFLFNKQQLDQPGHYEWATSDKDAVEVSIKCDRWFYKYFSWLLHFSQNQFSYFCKR